MQHKNPKTKKIRQIQAKSIELMQQWQALGKLPRELLRDETLQRCKKAGLTSLQSYVYWAEIEKQAGIIDFSSYDELVEKLRKHDLKWVPFLVLGPYYATPIWFQKTSESVYAKCLEHGMETASQSIWNPNLPRYVDRFLRLVGRHYKDPNLLESVGLGISGNWGEAIYPVTGGFHQPDKSHSHPGWWCGDRYAISSFQKFANEKYESIKKLNAAWGTNFHDFEEMCYPKIRHVSFMWHCVKLARNFTKHCIKAIFKQDTTWDRSLFALTGMSYPFFRNLNGNSTKRWLHFISWYLGSMTKWAEFWVKTARKYFPSAEIYLMTGGDGNPILGADFSAQAKVVVKYNAGIRIINQGDDYARNFSLVASASRFYGAYFTTEEAWHNLPDGVVARIFDAATSGAKGVYFKDIISGDVGAACALKHSALGEPTQNLVNFVQNIHHLTGEKPTIGVAVLFPNISIALNPSVLYSIYIKSSQLRDILDFDFVDENMIADDVLGKYRFLVILDGEYVLRKTLLKIKEWIKAGGILISNVDFSTIEEGHKLREKLDLCQGEVQKIGRGYGAFSTHGGRGYLEHVKCMVYNRKRNYPWNGILKIDDEWDKVYATRFSNKIIYFNSTGTSKVKRVLLENSPQRFKFKLNMRPHSITTVILNDRTHVIENL